MQKVMLIGRLGRDIEASYDQRGTLLAKASLACDKKVKGEKATTWYRLTFYGKTGELAQQYLAKGSKVFVSGELEIREYTDKQGEKRTSYDVFVKDMEFLDPPKGQGQGDDAGDDF